jgi:hypothetical protein
VYLTTSASLPTIVNPANFGWAESESYSLLGKGAAPFASDINLNSFINGYFSTEILLDNTSTTNTGDEIYCGMSIFKCKTISYALSKTTPPAKLTFTPATYTQNAITISLGAPLLIPISS